MSFQQPCTQCYELNVCVPSKLVCWKPNSYCNIIRRWGLTGGISALRKETPESSLSLPALGGYSQKTAICNPEEGSTQNPTMVAPWKQASSLHNCEKSISVVYQLVYGIPLFWIRHPLIGLCKKDMVIKQIDPVASRVVSQTTRPYWSGPWRPPWPPLSSAFPAVALSSTLAWCQSPAYSGLNPSHSPPGNPHHSILCPKG